MTTKLSELTEEEVLRKEEEGKKLNIYRNMTGVLSYQFLESSIPAQPVYAAGYEELRAIPQMDDGGIAMMIPKDPIDRDPLPDPDPIIVTVDISSPAANAIISGIPTGAVVDFRGTAWVDSGDGAVKQVSVQIGSGAYQSATLNGDGTWVLPSVILSTPGQVQITAKALHTNNKATSIRKITVTVQLAQAPDLILPTVAVTSPSSGAVLSSGAVTIQGTAGDDRGVTRVELIQNNGAPVLTESGDGYRTWKKTITLQQGANSIQVRAYDAANNFGTTSISLYADTTLPKIGILSPLNGAQVAGTFSQGAVVEISGTAEDAGGIDYVEISTDHSELFTRGSAQAPGDWTKWKATLTFNTTGKHFVTARVVDRAKNSVETILEINVSIMPEVNSRLKRIILVESYRLSSYLANYGAGRTIKTFSLLPGEKSKISVRSYSQDEKTMKSAATIKTRTGMSSLYPIICV
ncbi:Ig-like domain-containing protein [Paenibacillus gansuensis]|uniref:Ig-like domain-containing protein n=1 Tax=Paenibacillus gansuensis TaxID=306542 RepID=A0ABW5PHW7_9BACL